MKAYRILTPDGFVTDPNPGMLAGNVTGKVFGRLDCVYGIRMMAEYRVFFRSAEDAVRLGYKPCSRCRPLEQADFETLLSQAPVGSLELFYRPRRFWKLRPEDAGLLDEFVRLVGDAVLEVGRVVWSGPHNASLQWETFKSWTSPPSPSQLSAAHLELLGDGRYFRICKLCKKRLNAGHMHDQTKCEGCAERHLGVVY